MGAIGIQAAVLGERFAPLLLNCFLGFSCLHKAAASCRWGDDDIHAHECSLLHIIGANRSGGGVI